MQRVTGLFHMQMGERSPGAAHRIESLADMLAQPAHALDRIDDDALGIGPARRHQTQRSDRQRARRADPAVTHGNQFEAAAAEIAHHAIGVGHAADHAEARIARFVLAAHDVGGDAGAPDHLVDEFLAVGGVAHGGRRQQIERRHSHVLCQGDEAIDIGERQFDASRIEPSGCVQAAGKAAQHFFVEQRQRRATRPFVDDESNRIRADVDDANALLVGDAPYDPGDRARFIVHGRTL